ncbi:predicted protein [Botrytis cinerea T4]|uniref:Uncharacterized protein n=1 Tax=Botryotinia fuckeliana (strain T4) TaxID=999810 RepID=G2YKA6_BOTF4|nr:predicted protein [Botrytis cinerea T4]
MTSRGGESSEELETEKNQTILIPKKAITYTKHKNPSVSGYGEISYSELNEASVSV